MGGQRSQRGTDEWLPPEIRAVHTERVCGRREAGLYLGPLLQACQALAILLDNALDLEERLHLL